MKARSSKRRRNVLRKNKFSLIIIFVLSLIVSGIFLGSWWSGNLKPVSDSGQTQAFVIEEGMSATQVAEELEKQKLIRSAEVFRQLCRIEKADAKLAAGLYELSPSMSSREILDLIIKGPSPEFIRITIPEGYTVAEIVNTLVKKGLGTEKEYYQVMQGYEANEYSFLKDVPSGNKRLEGFLFPDTYFFDLDTKPKEIIDRFLQRFEQELTTETVARLKELNISIFTWVNKASIVEKEAVIEDERPIIAGIFDKRLEIGMNLGSDPTVKYVMKEAKPFLTFEDIKIDSPYNTYKYPGLPPGPIANPGHASLNAVLYPKETEYLYFVAKNDGSHAFAVTYEEHLRNVSKYQ